MKKWGVAFICSVIFQFGFSFNALATECRNEALVQAQKLLTYHVEMEFHKEIDRSSLKTLKPITNPLNKSEKFEVLEVMGFVEKNEYRMHLIYFSVRSVCVLVGQEIIQIADF